MKSTGSSGKRFEHTMELPLGDDLLVIRETEKGYSFHINNSHGDTCEVFSILARITDNKLGHFQDNYLLLRRDYDDEDCCYKEALLHPNLRPCVKMLPNGRLFCTKCRCYVPNTANSEMRREGIYAHSHICGVPAAGEVYEEEKNEDI